MTDKLKEEELLERLAKWTDFYKPHIHNKELAYWLPDDQQAYQQIKELIQKPGITEEWVEEKAREFWDFPYYDCAFQDVKDFIRSLTKVLK